MILIFSGTYDRAGTLLSARNTVTSRRIFPGDEEMRRLVRDDAVGLPVNVLLVCVLPVR